MPVRQANGDGLTSPVTLGEPNPKRVSPADAEKQRMNILIQENARFRMALEAIRNMNFNTNSLVNAITTARVALDNSDSS